MDSLPPIHVCVNLVVSCLPCLGDPSHYTCWLALFLLVQSLENFPGILHIMPFLFVGHSLKLRFTAGLTEPLFSFCLCAVFAWKFCCLFLSSVKFFARLKLCCSRNFFPQRISHHITENQGAEFSPLECFPCLL